MANENSPLQLGNILNKNLSDRQQRDLQTAREEGFREGLLHQRKETISWLERAYISDEGRPDRGSPKGEAILEVTRELSKYLHSVVDRRGGRR